MRPVFSWNVFKGYLQEELSTFEYGFLKKVFSQAAFSFGAFGALICGMASLSQASWSKSFMDNPFVWGAVAVIALFSGVALMFYYLPRYHSNPMEVTPKFVKRAYIALIFTYGTIFYAILRGINFIGSVTEGSDLFKSILPGALLFGSTLFVYAIPASIGFFMRRQKNVLKLANFLKICYTAYLVLFLLALAIALIPTSSRQFLYQFHNIAILLVCGAIVFTSPILSVYRMKMVVRYLDQTDNVVIKKWELFFVFEILVQLMQMAIYLVRLFFNCLACNVIATRNR